VSVALLLSLAIAVSGLSGKVERGPTMPVCRAGESCSAPVVGAVLRFSRGGTVVAHTRTRTGGRYSIRLAPGVYSVSIRPAPRIGTGLRPRSVRVRLGIVGHVDFMLDTGIR
jgi:hypothetical protein